MVEPKIILLWGVHPNESPVTEYLIPRLKPLLESRGIKVEVVEYPRYKSPNELAHLPWPSPEKFIAIEPILRAKFQNELKERYPGAIIFDIHGYFRTRSLKNRPPRFLKGRLEETIPQYFTYNTPDILFAENNGVVTLEFPTMFLEDPKFAHLMNTDYNFPQLVYKSSLELTKAQKWLDYIVLRKVAHLIDFVTKTKLGIYRKPKGEPYKPKLDKETAKKNEREKQMKRELLRRRVA
jgi:hypothetical protein